VLVRPAAAVRRRPLWRRCPRAVSVGEGNTCRMALPPPTVPRSVLSPARSIARSVPWAARSTAGVLRLPPGIDAAPAADIDHKAVCRLLTVPRRQPPTASLSLVVQEGREAQGTPHSPGFSGDVPILSQYA
jgi:hypothetical protein